MLGGDFPFRIHQSSFRFARKDPMNEATLEKIPDLKDRLTAVRSYL